MSQQDTLPVPRVTTLSSGADAMDAQAVLASFNTWRFKREQPSDLPLVTSFVAHACRSGTPLRFVLYWGKGPRDEVAAPEHQCLDFLGEMAESVASAHSLGADITLIFTDTHAKLNGHATDACERYFRAVDLIARARRLNTTTLSSVIERANLGEHDIEIGRPSDALLLALTRSAEKWYRGGNARDGALAYFHQNMTERRAVELVYPDAIFVTFNGRDLRDLFPERLPIFYMYSLRKGVAVKPWFISEPIK